jgi:hypothetical protein
MCLSIACSGDGRVVDVRPEEVLLGMGAGQEAGHSDERTRQWSTARRRVSMVESMRRD